jgi:UDP-N-acetylmuramyl tripeptide synthase
MREQLLRHDVAVLTTDDPASEDPAKICQEIQAHITKEMPVYTGSSLAGSSVVRTATSANSERTLPKSLRREIALSPVLPTRTIKRPSGCSCQQGIAATTVPGRMESLTNTNGATVYVDYAHNYDSLKLAIAALNALPLLKSPPKRR